MVVKSVWSEFANLTVFFDLIRLMLFGNKKRFVLSVTKFQKPDKTHVVSTKNEHPRQNFFHPFDPRYRKSH